MKRTGWDGTIPPKGAYYPRYNRFGGIEYRDTNTGKIISPNGKMLGVEPPKKHIYGSDKGFIRVGRIKKLKKLKVK